MLCYVSASSFVLIMRYYSRLRTVELEREREKEDLSRSDGDRLKQSESCLQRERQRGEALLRRSLDAQELMRMQMTQESLRALSEPLSPSRPQPPPHSPPRSPPRRDAAAYGAAISPIRPEREAASRSPARESLELSSLEGSHIVPGSGSKPSSLASLRGEGSPPRGYQPPRGDGDGRVSPLMVSPMGTSRASASLEAQGTVTGSALGMSWAAPGSAAAAASRGGDGDGDGDGGGDGGGDGSHTAADIAAWLQESGDEGDGVEYIGDEEESGEGEGEYELGSAAAGQPWSEGEGEGEGEGGSEGAYEPAAVPAERRGDRLRVKKRKVTYAV
jgi:hypothetical protein